MLFMSIKSSRIKRALDLGFFTQNVGRGLKILAMALTLPHAAVADRMLMMAEEDGCYWCARWNKEIGPIYPKTTEGRIAPLRRYDLHTDTPDVAFARRVHFTPTFILVDSGKEVGRP